MDVGFTVGVGTTVGVLTVGVETTGGIFVVGVGAALAVTLEKGMEVVRMAARWGKSSCCFLLNRRIGRPWSA